MGKVRIPACRLSVAINCVLQLASAECKMLSFCKKFQYKVINEQIKLITCRMTLTLNSSLHSFSPCHTTHFFYCLAMKVNYEFFHFALLLMPAFLCRIPFAYFTIHERFHFPIFSFFCASIIVGD